MCGAYQVSNSSHFQGSRTYQERHTTRAETSRPTRLVDEFETKISTTQVQVSRRINVVLGR